MSGQQQASSEESDFDFPKDDDAFTSSEFKEDGNFTEGHGEGTIPAGMGKQSLFEGYKDPSKQFGGHTRSYHQEARYGRSPACVRRRLAAADPRLLRCRRFAGLHHGYKRTLNRHLWLRLYCQQQLSQLRTYHQDPTTVGGLTADDIEKARQRKRAEAKPHKQAVNKCPSPATQCYTHLCCLHRHFNTFFCFMLA